MSQGVEQLVVFLRPLGLRLDTHTDVLIIGGGIAGILCAYMLQQSGVDYILTEATEICSGITKNTTAKITSQHGLIYNKLMKQFGIEKARLYLDANEAAIGQYRQLCKSIDCEFEEKDNYVYARDSAIKLRQELEALSKLGYKGEYTDSLPLPFPIAGAIKFSRQAQFNPLQFLEKIAEGLHIYEHTTVQELAKKTGSITAFTNHGKITADKVIVTTHFPFLNKHGSYFLKMYQHRSYVLALENALHVKHTQTKDSDTTSKNHTLYNGMYVDADQTGLSFRTYKNLLLLGGGSHRTGKRGGGWKELEVFTRSYFPDAGIRYQWATQDCMTLDKVPYIGPYSARTEGLFVATGFNKWGMTSAMVAAQLLRDMVLEKENPYAKVFSPSRTILRPQLLINACEATINLLTPTTPRCPHLGCALKWNSQEHSWDCPCHGSRYTKEGKLIDNPATGDLNIS